MKTKLLTTLMFLGFFFTGELQGSIPGNYEAGKTVKSPDGQIALSPRLTPDHIVQKDERGIIEWSSFSLPSNEKLTIEQPGKTSVTLIRVTGSLPSTLDGVIRVNGTLLLVNPNGIVIGESARITGGSIYLSTEDIRDEDVHNGNYRFKGDSKMAIINNGQVEACGAGNLCGTIAMMAGRLVNNGILRANGGIVQMIAKNPGGYAISSIEHSGLAEAKTLPNGQKGEIFISAEGNLVEVTGRLDVSAPDYGNGGRIVVSGEYVKIDEHAVLSADGFHGGGEIFAGGSWMGCDPEIEKATGVFIAPSAILKANALKRGNGGTVVAYSDVINPNAVTRAYGTFEAYGGPDGGNGGNIETSGGWLDVSGSRGGASAPEGDAGTWLIDPYDITISSSTFNGSWSGGTFTPSGDNATIAASDIIAKLNSGTSVTISTSGAGTQKGTITVSSDITKTSGADVTLTLNADYRITIDAAISSNYNKLHFIGSAGLTAIGDGRGRIGQFNVTANGSITTNGGNITASGVNNSVSGGSWTGTAGTYSCVGVTCRGIQLDGNLNAGGGNISLTGLRRTGGLTRGVNITSTIQTSGSGTITIDGEGNGDAHGVIIEGSGFISAANGNVSITGDAELPASKFGIAALAATNLSTTGTGNVSLISTSGALSLNNLNVAAGGTTYLKATGYSISLGNANNSMSGTVTVHSGTSVAVTNKTAMTLGNVNSTDIVQIETLAGNLTLTGAVSTSNTSSNAIKLIAEKNKNAGDGTGGNIIVSGGSVSATSPGTILLYTGSISGSTGVTGLSNYSSSRVYYNSDENTALSPTPGAGLYVVYRGAGTPADPTSITASTNPICTGSSTQLTANGAVGTVYWYTGSCGGTLVTTGNPINVSPTSSTTYYARNYNNSLYSNGCASLLVNVEQTPVSGTLTKSPNQATVCEGSNVSATLTAGSGGSGIDSTYSRTQAGGVWSTWTAYTNGSNISTTGKTDVEIRTKRKGSKCSDGTWTTVSWSVEQTPVSGTLAKTPNQAAVCEGSNVSAALTAGSGGSSIDSTYSRTKAGGEWSSWTAYTSGSNISTTGKTDVEVRTKRKGTICSDASWTTVNWTVEQTPTTGTFTKNPDQPMVCENVNVSATLTAGSGGNGIDSTYSRTKSNSVWSSWTAYTSGANISTTGKTDVEIRTKRKGSQCPDGSWTNVNWSVEQTPVSGTLAKTPNQAAVCEGSNVSAALTAGSGGSSIDSTYSRTKAGGEWSSWTAYTSGSNISTTGKTDVEVRTKRKGTICSDASWTTVNWTVEQTPTTGTFTKNPDQPMVCENVNVSATLTAGSGGNGVDSTYSRTKSNSVWSSWTAYTSGTNISTTGKTDVEIRTKRKGTQCSDAVWTTVSWVVEQTPVSGTLLKSPDVTHVCEGTEVSSVLTPGDGGNSTDILQYRTRTSGNWTDWLIYAEENLSTTDLSDVEIRTYREADQCDDAVPNVVSWMVDPTTVGGTVSGGVEVCYGSNSTLLTLSGETGSVQRWQYSTDGTAWTDLSGVTETTYTAIDLTEATWYRAVVKSGVCAEENSDSTQITVFSDYHISGVVVYENNPKTPLGGLKIVLKKDGTPIGSPILTDNTGAYDFGNLTNGNYSLEISSAHSSGQWQTWSGVNNTDYLLVSKHITGTQLLPVDPPVVRTSASVKLPHPVINTVDATAIRQAAKFPLTGYNYFDSAKWVFSGIDATQALTNITLNCSDVVREIRGLCAGDVNGTYVPPSGYKTAVETLHATSLQLEHHGNLPLTDEMIFPIRVDRDMEIGAITLYLDFDPSVMIVTNVTTVTTVTNSPELWYNISEPPLTLNPSPLTTLQIGWMSPDPVKVAEGQAVILVHARLRDAVETLHATSLPSANPIRFTLNENPLSEFADGDGNVIDGLKLSMPTAGNSEIAKWRNSEIVVYPNPARSTLNIELETFNPEPETLNLELVNLQGVVVITREPVTITAGWYKDQLNLREIAPGVYFLRANLNGETVNKKIVITR